MTRRPTNMTRRPIRDAQHWDYTPHLERRARNGRVILWLLLCTLLTIVALVVAFTAPAYGQEAHPPTAMMGGDTLRLERKGSTLAVLTYHNNVGERSKAGVATLHHDGVTAIARVGFTNDGSQRERLIVTPPEGWHAFPPLAEVADGETVKVEIFRDWEGM